MVPEVETSDPTECGFVHSHTGYRWDPSTMLSGTAFHGDSPEGSVASTGCRDAEADPDDPLFVA